MTNFDNPALLLTGIPVVFSDNAVDLVSVQARTHRRPRINKKWLKRFGLKKIYKPAMYMLNTGETSTPTIICHPALKQNLVNLAAMTSHG